MLNDIGDFLKKAYISTVIGCLSHSKRYRKSTVVVKSIEYRLVELSKDHKKKRTLSAEPVKTKPLSGSKSIPNIAAA